MSTAVGSTDSNLSGKPSDDIDKQKGPSSGGNVESVDNTLPGSTKSAEAEQNQSGSGGTSGQGAQQHTQSSSS